MLQAYKQENWGHTDRTGYQRGGNAAQISKSHRTLGSLFAAITLSQASGKEKIKKKKPTTHITLLPLNDKVKTGNTKDQGSTLTAQDQLD